jgi:hypothetical protein
LEGSTLIADETEQQRQIDDLERIFKENEDNSNQEQLIQLHLWEQAILAVQQLNEH